MQNASSGSLVRRQTREEAREHPEFMSIAGEYVAWFSDMLHVAPDVRLFRLEVCIGINSPLIRHDGFPL